MYIQMYVMLCLFSNVSLYVYIYIHINFQDRCLQLEHLLQELALGNAYICIYIYTIGTYIYVYIYIHMKKLDCF